jgi:hypothetical protein
MGRLRLAIGARRHAPGSDCITVGVPNAIPQHGRAARRVAPRDAPAAAAKDPDVTTDNGAIGIGIGLTGNTGRLIVNLKPSA